MERWKVDSETGCWVWQQAIARNGYGVWSRRVGNKIDWMHAHRRMYLMHKGIIPSGLDLDHICRNRACVNPAHLEPVTPAINARRSPRIAKLSDDDVRDIRTRCAAGEKQMAVAAFYGINPSQVSRIVNRKRWA